MMGGRIWLESEVAMDPVPFHHPVRCRKAEPPAVEEQVSLAGIPVLW